LGTATATATSPEISLRLNAKALFFLVLFSTTIFAAYEKNSAIFDPTSPIAQHYAPAKWFVNDPCIVRNPGDGSSSVSVFQPLTSAVSPTASQPWIYVRDERLHCGPVRNSRIAQNLAYIYGGRGKLHAVFVLARDYCHRAVLRSQGQCHSTPPLDAS